MSEWISVKDERKPKFLERILVCYCNDVVREGFYRDDFNKWYIYGWGGLGDVEVNATHWMYLPEPPEEAEKAETELIEGLAEMNRHYYERQIILEDENKRLRKALSNARTDVCVKCGKQNEGIQCQECEYLYELPREVK